MPEATISGTVTDQHAEPVVANIELLKRAWLQGKPSLQGAGHAVSDSHGRFLLSGVEPGRYLLRADSRNQYSAQRIVEVDREGNPVSGHLVSTFYGDTTDDHAATLIAIQSGQAIDGANIRLVREPTFHVKARIVSVPNNESPQSYFPFLLVRDGFLGTGFGQRPDKNGSFQIDNVQPGSYTLSLSHMGPMIAAFSIPIEVTNSNIDVLEISIPSPVDISGRVAVEGHPDADRSGMQLSLMTNRLGAVQASTGGDGTFTLKNVMPGHYSINLRVPGEATFIKAVQFGGRSMPENTVDIAPGASGSLEILLSSNPAELDGVVTKEDPDSQAAVPASAINVVMIPEKRTEEYFGDLKFASTDAQGHFTLKGIEPGEYKVFAADGIEASQWTDPEVAAALSGHAIAIDLKEADKKQVELKLITAEESAQVLDRLGL